MRVGDPDGYGRYGLLDERGGRVLCHECGEWKKSVGSHLRSHGITPRDYRRAHGLAASTPLVASELSEKISDAATSRVGSEGWDRMVAKRDPTKASRSRTAESFVRRGTQVEVAAETAKKNIAGVQKPRTKKCPVCGEYARRRKTCSDQCEAISLYRARGNGPRAMRWAERHDNEGASWSGLGREGR